MTKEPKRIYLPTHTYPEVPAGVFSEGAPAAIDLVVIETYFDNSIRLSIGGKTVLVDAKALVSAVFEAAPSSIPPATNDVESLREALRSVYQYGRDTQSGPSNGPPDFAWYRDAVIEMTKRAQAK